MAAIPYILFLAVLWLGILMSLVAAGVALALLLLFGYVVFVGGRRLCGIIRRSGHTRNARF
jgi:hypothetical protein